MAVVLLAACMVAVALSSLGRALLPSCRAPDHGRDLDGWHVAMAGATAAMLLAAWARPVAVAVLGLFVVGLGWAVVRASARASRAAYVRLATGCAAMIVMLLPAVSAPAASAAPVSPLCGDPGPAMDRALREVDLAGTPAVAGPGLGTPTVLVVATLLALSALLGIRLVASLRPARAVASRLEAGSDVAMTAAMGFMLVQML